MCCIYVGEAAEAEEAAKELGLTVNLKIKWQQSPIG